MIAGCIDTAGIDAADIIGVGCAGHGNGLYLLDMSGCDLTSMPDCAYDDGLLALFGLSDASEVLSRLIDPAEVAGAVSAEAAAATGLAEVQPVADDSFFHPFLFSSGQGASFRGVCGVSDWHGEGHMLRAPFEGVLFEHRRHIGVMKAAGISFDQAVLLGGGSRGPVWPQMFADCLGVPI
ncbi:FGGY-family carbohydrate kinase [Ruegeria atlantica]|uniref:L-xylulose/3-keto-L-gulonate kinase n=1 Tax=Ruegeria atlantica TaxID=81569 RepID=A0A0P1EKK4_9RHOB|nr:FGGY-family carbohydrate kinase [Ruegeria atlantica]CUH41941.1 L-xylulose/3-keto-L-gulonate kinase [Ruegeria atlantica]